MNSKTFSRMLVGILIAISGSLSASQIDTIQPVVSAPVPLGGPVVGVSCSLAYETSPHMAVDPFNSNHLAVVYSLGDTNNPVPDPNIPVATDPTGPIQTIQLQAAIVANSYDGGHTWSRAVLPRMTACTGGENGEVGDPFIAIS